MTITPAPAQAGASMDDAEWLKNMQTALADRQAVFTKAECASCHAEPARGKTDGAEFEHIGSAAIPGALTKGDLDVLVRVEVGEFRVAEEALAGLFMRNEGTPRTETFASFKDEAVSPPVGIQLVVRGSEWDVFSRFRDALNHDRRLVLEYNRLKERFQNQSMAEYRSGKEQFIERVLAGASD